MQYNRLIPGKLCKRGHLLVSPNLRYSITRGTICFRCNECSSSHNKEVRGENKGRKPEKERFLNSLIKTENCWIWKANGRYSFFKTDANIMVLAHRYSFEFHGGILIEGLVIDHTCSNTHCVNPEHLEQVTQQENVIRAYRRRQNKIKMKREK